MSDPLEQLLRRADSASACAPPAGDLPQRVRRQFIRRRRATKAIASSAVALLIFASLGLVLANLHGDKRLAESAEQPKRLPAPPSNRQTQASASIAELDFTAHLHERIADELLANQSARKHRIPLAAQDPTLAKLQQQRDRAALLLVYQADQYRKQNEPRQAIAAYQRTIELFPQSHWATIARHRLKQTQDGA